MEPLHRIQPPSQIRQEANEWVLKINGDEPPSDDTIAELKAWAARSPAHKQELLRAEQFWREANLLTALELPEVNQAEPARSWRRPITAIAASLVIAISAAFVLPMLQPTESADSYATRTGELRQVILDDGSQLHLDTESLAEVEYEESTRSVELISGKAYFDVASDPDRPFIVETPYGSVRAVGTAFSVSIVGNDVEVTVDEGTVELRQAETKAEEGVYLTEGQQANFNTQTAAVNTLEKNQMDKEMAWRKGLLIFAGEPLVEVVSEVTRYTETRIEITDPALADIQIGGRFRTGELKALFGVLETGFDVNVKYVDANVVELSTKKR